MRQIILARALVAMTAGLPVLLAPSAGVPQESDVDLPVVNRTVSDAPLNLTPSEELPDDPVDIDVVETGELPAEELIHVPITGIFPGTVRPEPPPPQNPVEDDLQAAWRGMAYYNQFNCVGCHAPNGSGGMGPSLSNATFKYGEDDANIFLTIKQGRPLGMPYFGGILTDQMVWDLVEYVQAISKEPEPGAQWGVTTSLEDFGPEQVPAQYMSTITPWANTQPFSYGKPPFVPVEVPEKPE